jgi:hypothetical protein
MLAGLYKHWWKTRNKQLHPDDGDPMEIEEIKAQIKHWYDQQHRVNQYDRHHIFNTDIKEILTKPIVMMKTWLKMK